jgi:hypothetical protein
MTVGVLASVGIFLFSLLVGFFKYVHNLDVSIRLLCSKFEERTTTISKHLSKIDGTLKELADSTMRVQRLELDVADHEGRIRNLEVDCH